MRPFGARTGFAGSALGDVDAVIPAMLASVLTLILVSLAGKPPEEGKWRPFF